MTKKGLTCFKHGEDHTGQVGALDLGNGGQGQGVKLLQKQDYSQSIQISRNQIVNKKNNAGSQLRGLFRFGAFLEPTWFFWASWWLPSDGEVKKKPQTPFPSFAVKEIARWPSNKTVSPPGLIDPLPLWWAAYNNCPPSLCPPGLFAGGPGL